MENASCTQESAFLLPSFSVIESSLMWRESRKFCLLCFASAFWDVARPKQSSGTGWEHVSTTRPQEQGKLLLGGRSKPSGTRWASIGRPSRSPNKANTKLLLSETATDSPEIDLPEVGHDFPNNVKQGFRAEGGLTALPQSTQGLPEFLHQGTAEGK